jgi:hypothetical protein
MYIQKWTYILLVGMTLVYCSVPKILFAQDDPFNYEKKNNSKEEPLADTYEEKIKKVSPSRKIFLISNNNKILYPGDYFTILIKNNPVARGLVAKERTDTLGIKVIKLYSMKGWYQLLPGKNIRILKGDDSRLFVKKRTQSESPEVPGGDMQDIYDDPSSISEELDFEDNKNRIIKTDNVIGVAYGSIESLDSTGGYASYDHFSFNWSYQFLDNFWAEAAYGQTLMSSFPATDIDCKLTNISLRMKYVFEVPFHSYMLPFIGVQILTASSPEAGTDPSGASSTSQLAYELELVTNAAGTKVLFGVTFLKRLVPGWFAKVDLGSDLFSIGVALEF